MKKMFFATTALAAAAHVPRAAFDEMGSRGAGKFDTKMTRGPADLGRGLGDIYKALAMAPADGGGSYGGSTTAVIDGGDQTLDEVAGSEIDELDILGGSGAGEMDQTAATARVT